MRLQHSSFDTRDLDVFGYEGLWVQAVVFCSFGDVYDETLRACVEYLFIYIY